MNKKSKLVISVIFLTLFTQCMVAMAAQYASVDDEGAQSSRMNASVPPTEFDAFIGRILPIIRDGGGYLTHSKLKEILGVDFPTYETDDGGLSSSYESRKAGELSFRLLELGKEPRMPFWEQARFAVNGVHSVLDISMGSHCYSVEEAKSQFLSAGLLYRGGMPYLGEKLYLFADKQNSERIFVYANMKLDRIPSCVQSMRLVGYRKGG